MCINYKTAAVAVVVAKVWKITHTPPWNSAPNAEHHKVPKRPQKPPTNNQQQKQKQKPRENNQKEKQQLRAEHFLPQTKRRRTANNLIYF